MRTYIETSVLADWFFVRTMKLRTRRKLRPSVQASYRLIKKILHGTFPLDSFVTSRWAVLEAVGTLKRSRIMFNMLMQNVSPTYYDAVKDKKGFRLERYQIEEIKKLIAYLGSETQVKRLSSSDLLVDFDSTISFVMFGLDPPDALHAAIARDERCENLVTRDRDLLDRRKVLSRWFEVVEPRVALTRLEERRRTKPHPS